MYFYLCSLCLQREFKRGVGGKENGTKRGKKMYSDQVPSLCDECDNYVYLNYINKQQKFKVEHRIQINKITI